MISPALLAIGSIVIGAVSLHALLLALRHTFPTVFPSDRSKLHRVFETQALRGASLAIPTGSPETLLTSIKTTEKAVRHTGKLTLAKRLRFAQWRISPLTYRILSACLSGLFVSLTVTRFNVAIQAVAIIAGPILMHLVLERSIERRSRAFDADYPQFLMSMVGLLKTGMTSSGALETAAHGLAAGSLVRHEALLALERIRVGVLEDKSIGAFGENIHHPEIELFVQALLLSNRIGGNLSESLERLSKQVRKRQYFKTSAVSAVALQRSSIVVIVFILILLEGYIGIMFPALIFDSLATRIGWHIWQVSIAAIVIAFLWVRRVTKLKV
jgi:tight adherence protein B